MKRVLIGSLDFISDLQFKSSNGAGQRLTGESDSGTNLGPMRNVFFTVLLCVLQSSRAAEPLGESHRVKTDDNAEIHYLLSGPADSGLAPILFVPGYLMPADVFEFQLRHFAKVRRVVAMDPRSQGKSARISRGHYPSRRAKDIQAVAEHAGLKKFVLAGWSLGVIEALSFYEQFGAEKLQALVFIDGDLSYEVGSPEAAAGEIQFLKFVAGVAQANRAEGLRAFVRSIYAKPPPDGHLERVTSSVLNTSEDTALALLVNRIGFGVREGLDKIGVPALVVLSERNGNKERTIADAKKMPKAEIHVLGETGHALFVDKPEEFNRLVEEFLRRN